MKALIVNGVVHEVVTSEAFDTFNPEVQAACVDCDDTVRAGMLHADGVFAPPTPQPTPAPRLPTLTPLAFYLAFTPAERIAIKASSDAMVRELWATYEVAAAAGAAIDPNLASVRGGLDYLLSQGILATDERIAQVLQGEPR